MKARIRENLIPPTQHLLEEVRMPLYLDDQTRPYLEKLVKNIKDTDFIGKRVQKMLEADRERLNTMGTCEHVSAQYIGKKTCCGICGSFYEVGMGQEWTKSEK